MSNVERSDITKRLRGEIREQKVALMYNGVEIGSIPFDSSCVQMDQGFECDDNRIYRLDRTDLPHPQQYVSCDYESGWC